MRQAIDNDGQENVGFDAKEAALEGLNIRQKRLVMELPKHDSISAAARAAGYSKTTANVTVYRQLKCSPRLRRAISIYHDLGDVGLGQLAAATLVDLLSSKSTKDEVRASASKLALQVAGKLKNVNFNVGMNNEVDVTAEDLARLFGLFSDSPPGGDGVVGPPRS